MKTDEIYIETFRGEDASIASLQGIPKPYQLDSLTVVFDFSINREMRPYHERANAIRPYNNGILLCNYAKSKPP